MDTKKLRQKILDLAIRGKLVPQDPNDEPASVLIEKIRAEKERLIKEKKIKRDKNESYIYRSDKSYYEKFADGTVKCIDVEIPFEIPESWEWCRLGFLCDYGICINVQATDIPQTAWILDLEDIEKDTGTLLVRVCRFQRESKSVRHAFKKGDVLYSKLRTYLNKVIVADQDGYSTTEIIPLDFKGFVIAEYARCVLMSNMFLEYTAQCGYGVKMPRLGTNDGKRALFPLPPLSEQRQIITRINNLILITSKLENDKAELYDIVKQAKSKILDLAIRGKLVPQDPNDELASLLLERIKAEHPESNKKASKTSDNSHYTFSLPESWEWTTLGEISQHNTGKTLDKSRNSGFLHKYITTSNLYWDSFILDNLKEMPFEENELEKYSALEGDLLICEGGDGGRSAIWDKEYPICFQNHIHRVRPFSGIRSKYIYFFMFYSSLNGYINYYKKGIGIQSLSGNSLSSIKLPLPPISEQKRIVKKIEEAFSYLDEIADSIKA